jgi:hypothetical protein
LVMGAVASVQATPIPGLFNTGVDGTGAALPAGTIDPHYMLIASDDPQFPAPPPSSAFVTDSPLPGTWAGNASNSQWISPNALQTSLGTNFAIAVVPTAGNAAGTYMYDLPFSMAGLSTALATISGAWAVDDIGQIYLNGVYIDGTTNLNGAGTFTTFNIPAGSPFVAGINHLDFLVVNTTTGSTGLQVVGLSGNSPGIPEPSTIVLGGMGFVGLLVVRLHRGRKH